MEDPRRERRAALRGVEHVREVLRLPRARRRDHRDGHRVGDESHELVVEPVPLPVLVDAVEQDLSAPEILHRDRQLVRADVPALPPAIHGALEPHVLLAVRTRPRRLDAPVLSLRGVGDVRPPRVDGHDHRLDAVSLADLLDARAPVFFLVVGVVLLGDVHGVGADGDLIRASLEVRRRHLQRGVGHAVGVGEISNAAAHGEGNEDGLGRPSQHLEHGRVRQRQVPVSRDVQERHLVRALLEVLARELDGFAEVAHVVPVILLSNVVGIPLGHHQVPRVVGPDVEARDDALGEAEVVRVRGEFGLRPARAPLLGVALEEVSKDGQSLLAGLLRVKLARHHLALLHRRDELPAVLARRQHPVLVGDVRGGAVRVDKVQPVPGWDVGHEPGVALKVQGVPSDVRDDEAVAAELAHDAGDDAEALHPSALLAAVEQQLQAEADAHERLAGRDVVLDGVDEPARREDVHGGPVRADAREDELVRGGDARGVVHGLDREAQGLDGVANAPNVAGAVVQEGHLPSALGGEDADRAGRADGAARRGADAHGRAAGERARGAPLELRPRGERRRGGGDGRRDHGHERCGPRTAAICRPCLSLNPEPPKYRKVVFPRSYWSP